MEEDHILPFAVFTNWTVPDIKMREDKVLKRKSPWKAIPPPTELSIAIQFIYFENIFEYCEATLAAASTRTRQTVLFSDTTRVVLCNQRLDIVWNIHRHMPNVRGLQRPAGAMQHPVFGVPSYDFRHWMQPIHFDWALAVALLCGYQMAVGRPLKELLQPVVAGRW